METALQRIKLAKKTNSTTLNLCNFKLKYLPLKLFEVSTLILNLCNFKLKYLPFKLFEVSSLTELDLSCNHLVNIPKEICQLMNLTKLDLSYNCLVNIPKAICQLTNLTELDLNNNKLSNIPMEIGQLRSLTHLYLSFNQLVELSKEIGQLSSLSYLLLSFDQLVELSKEIGQLSSLSYLSLSYNQLVELSKEIGQLSLLSYLSLSYNQLANIPKEIGQLSSLTKLCLNGNNLVNIPNEIGQLRSLTELDLRNNKLLAIPKEIGQLSSLIILGVSYNQLTSLPIELIRLRHAEIYYSNNPIEYIPPNLLRFLQRDRNDYQQVYSDGQNVHNHAIQDSIAQCINYVISHKPTIKTEQLNEFIINNKYLSEQTKRLLMEYSNNLELHSRFGLSFSELLLNVLSLIENCHHDYKDTIYAIMNQEMVDAQCKCFTGRISRLVNCLNGFDEHIIIQISNSEQIGNIIGLIQRQLESNGTYSIQNHQNLVRKELMERGYDDKVINEWVNAI
jgi:Leucine-rich repeat (LRR) protein